MNFPYQISIVIPLYNEAESLPELQNWIARVLSEANLSYEIIYIDDGSTDTSWQVVQELAQKHPTIKAKRFARNYGKSAGLNVGFAMAQGEVVFTMDADLQDSPDELPAMRKMVVEDGFDLVSGWKKVRHDPISKTVPTKIYNWATRVMSGIKLHDFNCGLKAYKNAVVKSVEVHGEMHRYIPVMAKRHGFKNIGEKVVEHRARKYGYTKFGYERFINGFLDLLTITFISKFGKKPMHIFGTLGTLLFVLGFVLFGVIGGKKVISLFTEQPLRNITELSSFYIALTAMVMGTQMFLAGFLAELISRNDPTRNSYQVSEVLGE